MGIYLDHNATTPIDPAVVDEMVPFLKDNFGNPSSIHWCGRMVRRTIDTARTNVARLINANEREIVFTSGGTESDNSAITGAFFRYRERGNHIISTTVEHPAVLKSLSYLERVGAKITLLPVDQYGNIDLNELKTKMTKNTILITIMYANNEIGNVYPIREIVKIAKENDILVHTDAVQAAGKIPVDVKELGVDLLSFSSHKIYGPKGIGALYIKEGVKIDGFMHGGHQERGRRGGTENTIGIAGFGKASEIAFLMQKEEMEKIAVLRDRLERGILERISDVTINGNINMRVPGTTNLSFRFIEGEAILLNLDMYDIAASSGSACTSGSLEPSHVLVALGIPKEEAHGSVRFSIGRGNTVEDIDTVLNVMPEIVTKLRDMSPLYIKSAEKKG